MAPSYRPQGSAVSRKPDRITAMQQIIDAVKQEFPLYQPDTFKCGPDNTCIGCPKKLMELVDTDLSYWQYQIDRGIPPSFDEIQRFGEIALCGAECEPWLWVGQQETPIHRTQQPVTSGFVQVAGAMLRCDHAASEGRRKSP